MHVLLTGANGFLGKVIANKIKDKCDLFLSSKSKSDYNCDLSICVPKFSNDFDLVIHSAGLAHIVVNEKSDSDQFYLNNIKATENLLAGIESRVLPKYFVYISSVSVYGVEFGIQIDENTELNAKDPYGQSKICAEKIILEWCDKNNVVCTILRLPIIVGENPKGNLGDLINSIEKGLFFNISGIRAQKSMVLAEDVASAILNVYKIGGIFNLTDGYHPTIKELSNLISLQYRNKINPELPNFFIKFTSYIGDFFGRLSPINTKRYKKLISTLTFDDSKARKLFGWNPTQVLNYNYKLFKIIKENNHEAF